MRFLSYAVAFTSLLLTSQAFGEIIVFASGGYCPDLSSGTQVSIDFERRGVEGSQRGWASVDVSCGSYSSQVVYVTGDAYCTVTSFGCPGGTGSIYCYQGSESNGTGFSLTCPM